MFNDLIGKFFLNDQGETYRTGEFVATAGNEHVLVKFDNIRNPGDAVNLLMVVSYKSLADVCADEDDYDVPKWTILESREDLKKHIAWLNGEHIDHNDHNEDAVVIPLKSKH
jgi:hypothetical protein